MSEQLTTPKATVIDLPSPDGIHIEQTSTRGDGSVELGEAFEKDRIVFSDVVEHLAIHTEGQVAGSQFNGEVFSSPDSIIGSVQEALPENLQYDQHGRAEITLTVEGVAAGYSGVKSLAELETKQGVSIEKAVRMPGGEPGEVEGIQGSWFPEMTRDSETGRFEVATNPDGSIKNSHGKFEPEAFIAKVSKSSMSEALATDSLTVIIQKNHESGLPTVLTIFPGENAPAFPAKIETDSTQVDSLKGGPEAAYWTEHAFVRPDIS